MSHGQDEMTTDVFIYGVVGPEAQVQEGLLGVGDSPVRVILAVGDPIAAVVSDVSTERPPGRKADLLAYGRVLDSLALEGPVAPVRFGSVMDDDLAVIEDLLAPNAEWFGALLADLKGRVQFNLRATYEESTVLAEVVRGDPEIAHLRELTRDLPPDSAYGERVRLGELVARALETKRDADSEMIMDVVSAHVVDVQARPGSGVDHVLKAALLVDQAHQDDFEHILEGLAEVVHERIHLSLVGPLAPYDFVGDV